ncbi:hypothetical protein AUP68_08637 [Ilyonectria robusta]
MTLTGVFVDVVGLSYKTGGVIGKTTVHSEFSYNPGEEVTFSIGNVVLGSCVGKSLVTVSDLVSVDIPTFDPRLVNRARLLFSLTPGQGFEQGIKIDQKVEETIGKYAQEINLDSEDLSALDGPLGKICNELGLRPKSVPHARNHLRRETAGFKVLRDLQIPSPNGGYILADVYLPLQPRKKFPVLLSCTLYGRRVPWSGPDIEDEQDILRFERAEDHWHSTPEGVEVDLHDAGPWLGFFPTQRGFENIATFNTFSYVPHGYAMVKIDPKGVSQTPGTRWAPGDLPDDFLAAVEWSVKQPWSNGNAGLVGSSYGANTQWAVAGAKPKGLKCFVPYATDIDSYREAANIGGIPSIRYLKNWFARVREVSPKWKDSMDVEALMEANETYSKFWEMLDSSTEASIDIPCFLAASQIFMIHGRGAFEAWMARRPENTHLQLVDSNYYSWPSRESSTKIMQFLDHYLKGEETLAPERVGIQMRLGNRDWYWRTEQSWPVPGTKYTNWHLTPDGGLSSTPLEKGTPETRLAYSARAPSVGRSGVSFHSPAFTEDVDLAGHFVAVLSVSSTAADADVTALLWAVDETGTVVSYGASSDDPEPVAKGFLRVSHRHTDPELSLPWRPWHTHLKEHLGPLRGAEDVVEIAIEILPAAARVRKGWKLRLDVCPSEDQPNIPGYKSPGMRLWYGETHGEEDQNAIHIGGGRTNYILCPVVPERNNYPNYIV